MIEEFIINSNILLIVVLVITISFMGYFKIIGKKC